MMLILHGRANSGLYGGTHGIMAYGQCV